MLNVSRYTTQIRCYNTCVAIAGAILLIAVSNCLPARGETIELTNGTSLTGTLLKSDGTVFTFIVDNKTVTKKREEIAAIVFVQRKNPPAAAKESEMKAAANAAVEALEALDSVTKSGVTLVEYSKRKADAQIILDRFLNKYGKDSPVGKSLEAAMGCHNLATLAWPWAAMFYMGGDVTKKLVEVLPDLNSRVIGEGDSRRISREDVLSTIWNRGREYTKIARQQLSSIQ